MGGSHCLEPRDIIYDFIIIKAASQNMTRPGGMLMWSWRKLGHRYGKYWKGRLKVGGMVMWMERPRGFREIDGQ